MCCSCICAAAVYTPSPCCMLISTGTSARSRVRHPGLYAKWHPIFLFVHVDPRSTTVVAAEIDLPHVSNFEMGWELRIPFSCVIPGTWYTSPGVIFCFPVFYSKASSQINNTLILLTPTPTPLRTCSLHTHTHAHTCTSGRQDTFLRVRLEPRIGLD